MCIAALCATRKTLPPASSNLLAFGVLYLFSLFKPVFRGSLIYSFALSENHHTGDADAHILVLFPICKLLDGFPKLKGFPDFRLSLNVAYFPVAAGKDIA